MKQPFLCLLASIVLGLTFGGAAMAGIVELDGFEKTPDTTWRFMNGPEFPGAKGAFAIAAGQAHSGRRCGRLGWDFSGGGNYVQAGRDIPQAGHVLGLRLWLKKPHGNSIGVRFTDSEGQTFQKSFNFPKRTWREVQISLGGWAVSWGGKNDGVFRGEPTQFAILIDNNADKAGALYLDDLRLVTGEKSAPGSGPVTYSALRLSGERFDGDHSLFGQPSSLALKMDAPAGSKARVVVGSHFHSYERELTTPKSGPQTLESPLGGMEGWKTSGSETGIQYPLRILSIHGSPGVHLNELQITTQVAPADRVVLIPSGRMEGDQAAFTVTIQSILPDKSNGRLRYVARDWAGGSIEDGEIEAALPAGGAITKEISLPAGGRPFVEVECRFETPSGSYGPVTECAVQPEKDLPPQSPSQASPWGIGVYLYRYGGDATGLKMMDEAAAMAERVGVNWSREEMQWHRIEPERGKFDWSFYDKLLDTAERHGIQVYGLIAYWSSWTKPYTREGIEDYARYCTALVTHYKDRIHHWEIYNEPNIFFWSGPKDLYPELLKAAYKAVKAADPDALVLGCSTAGIDSGFIDMVNKARAPYDILTVHPYRSWLNERSFMDELRGARKLTAFDGKPKPVWITEMGWATPVGGTTQREQACLLARCYLAAVAADVQTNVSWYDFRDDGRNPFYHEHHFGVIRNDMTPKPAYRALATVCRTLPDARLKKALKLPQALLGFVFDTTRGPVTVIWNPEQTALLRLSADGEAPRNLMGEKAPLLETAGGRTLMLQPGSPVFLPGDLSGALETGQPQVTVEDMEDSGTLRVTLAGLSSGVRANLSAPEGWSAREIENKQAYVWDLTPPEGAGGAYEARFSISVGEKTLAGPLKLNVEPALLKV